jgi:hypothetical protein
MMGGDLLKLLLHTCETCGLVYIPNGEGLQIYTIVVDG